MPRKKKAPKAKEAIRIRFRKLANGNQSLYLDYYQGEAGARQTKTLNLYLVPEVDKAARIKNENTMQAANVIKNKLLLELINGKAGIKDISESGNISLVAYIDGFCEYLRKQNKSSKYVDSCRQLKRKVELFRPNAKLKDVDKKFICKFTQHLTDEVSAHGKKRSTETVRLLFNLLGTVLRHAYVEHKISRNPMDEIPSAERPKHQESTREFLTAEEVKMLQNTSCKSDEIKRAFLFSCYCGLRCSDIRNLTWNDIAQENGKFIARIIIQKTKTPLALPLSSMALSYLPERGKDEDRVFYLPTQGYVNEMLKQWAEAAGIKKHVTFHVARHTFATLCITADVDIFSVSKLLGHHDVKITEVYAKLIDKKKEEAVNKIEQLFN